MKKRVVVTGLGTINSVGHSVAESWEAMLSGTNGIDKISKFDVENFASHMAGEIKNFDPTEKLDKKSARKLDAYSIFMLVAAEEAMNDANLIEGSFDSFRAGCIMGCGIGGMDTFEHETGVLLEKGPRRISPQFIPKMIINAAAAGVAIKFNLKGPNFTCSSACASANHALGNAFRTVQYGDADIVVTGGSEAAVTPLSVAGFCSMKALSTRNDDVKTACRPFDAERDGFVIGEGAGVLVFEELEHAKARGAKIYAEVVGYGATCDAYHITAPSEGGEGGVRAMRSALLDAEINPEEVQYISAHGTSTPYNDPSETLSIKTVFGDHAKNLKINSTKSMIGHTLGGAAAIEGIVCCKSIETGKVHPTINIFNPDPACDLDYVAGGAEELTIDVALSNSLGFGGHNGVVVFKKYKA